MKMKAIVFSLCLLLPLQASAQGVPFGKWLTVGISARALDTVSTCMVFRLDGQPIPGRPDYVYRVEELNPMLPFVKNCPSIIAAQAGLGALQTWLVTRPDSVARPTLTKWLLGIQIALNSTAAVWNFHQHRKATRQ